MPRTRNAKERRESRHNDDFQDCDDDRTIQHSPHMMQMTAELVPKFSGCDKIYPVSRWIEDVESNAEIFGWSPLQQLLVARRSLTGTAQLWLRAERPFKSWEDLSAALSKEFPDALDTKTIHELMSARKKGENETCLDYMLIMKELGRRGKMADYVAIKYIVDGILDRDELRMRAKQQILKVQEENRKTFDRNRKESSTYKVGDLVAIKRTQFGPGLKLKPKYLGPYRITKVKRNDRYDVDKVDVNTEGPNRTSSAADQMKRWPIPSEE